MRITVGYRGPARGQAPAEAVTRVFKASTGIRVPIGGPNRLVSVSPAAAGSVPSEPVSSSDQLG